MESSRPASADDIPRVVELAELMRAELGAMRGGSLWLEREAWPEPLGDAYGALLARDDALLLVGAIDDAVIAFAAVVIEELRSGARLGVITDLFVEPEAREVGVGEVLADAMVAALPRRRLPRRRRRRAPGSPRGQELLRDPRLHRPCAHHAQAPRPRRP